jgi:kynurenine formamidase
MSQETLRTIARQVRTWGRWGPDDELGTLNYITPETIAAACRLATAGKVFALGIPLGREGPQSGTRQRFNPIHTMFRDGGDQPRTPDEVVTMQGYGGSDDWIVMPLQCVTQWDSLAHVFDEGKMYNGYDATLVTSSGAAKNSIDKTKSRIAGRGVLLDVARHQGLPALAPGYAITPADLDATAAAQKVEVQRGDILLIRTGHMAGYLARGDWRHFDLDESPGVSVHTAPWMHARQIAAVASDNYAVEVRPSELPPFRSPFHICAIPNMGLTLGEIFFLEELAADCAADGRYAFLLVARRCRSPAASARRSTPTRSSEGHSPMTMMSSGETTTTVGSPGNGATVAPLAGTSARSVRPSARAISQSWRPPRNTALAMRPVKRLGASAAAPARRRTVSGRIRQNTEAPARMSVLSTVSARPPARRTVRPPGSSTPGSTLAPPRKSATKRVRGRR